MNSTKTTAGTCPHCGSQFLNYGKHIDGQTPLFTNEGLYYEFTCIRCKFRGEEHYNVEYSHSINI
jgi:C4-type Zn-finger protein